jgi:hypothetical protein
VLLLAGCATPEARLRNGLIQAGLTEPLATCMAGRMADRLSLAQLRRLSDLSEAGEAATLDELLHRVRAIEDPELWTVTSGAAARCALSL